MKKFLFGILITFIGFFFFASCFIYIILNPGTYNGIDGLRGALLCSDLMIPFICSFIVLVIGIVICGYEAYGRK